MKKETIDEIVSISVKKVEEKMQTANKIVLNNLFRELNRIRKNRDMAKEPWHVYEPMIDSIKQKIAIASNDKYYRSYR